MPGGHKFYRVGFYTSKRLTAARREAQRSANSARCEITVVEVRPRAHATTLERVIEIVSPEPRPEGAADDPPHPDPARQL